MKIEKNGSARHLLDLREVLAFADHNAIRQLVADCLNNALENGELSRIVCFVVEQLGAGDADQLIRALPAAQFWNSDHARAYAENAR